MSCRVSLRQAPSLTSPLRSRGSCGVCDAQTAISPRSSHAATQVTLGGLRENQWHCSCPCRSQNGLERPNLTRSVGHEINTKTSIIAAALLGLVVSSARADQTMRVRVPVPFQVGGAVLPAGQYLLSRNLSGGYIWIRGMSRTTPSAVAMGTPLGGHDSASHSPSLVLNATRIITGSRRSGIWARAASGSSPDPQRRNRRWRWRTRWWCHSNANAASRGAAECGHERSTCFPLAGEQVERFDCSGDARDRVSVFRKSRVPGLRAPIRPF